MLTSINVKFILDSALLGFFISANILQIADVYGALLVPYTRTYSIILGMYSFVFMANTFLPLARLFFSGATFFLWRDFFLLARLFFH